VGGVREKIRLKQRNRGKKGFHDGFGKDALQGEDLHVDATLFAGQDSVGGLGGAQVWSKAWSLGTMKAVAGD